MLQIRTVIYGNSDVWWICGKWAYRQLPANWMGSCYVGCLIPGVWLLNDVIETPKIRVQRDIDLKQIASGGRQHWGEDEWPPERIVQHYDPATWDQHELIAGMRSSGYLTNRIIRLQAVVEIITNKTADALKLAATQLTQLRQVVIQNRLALDYLLAAEGGVCKLVNDSNCCIDIDDNGQAIINLAEEMKKVAHVPVQTWKGWDFDWLTNWLPGTGWLKQIFFVVVLIFVVISVIICFIPCLISLIRKLFMKMMSRQMVVIQGRSRCVRLRMMDEECLESQEGGNCGGLKEETTGLAINMPV